MTTYTITLTDGTVLTTIVPQALDTTHTSLTLWGQGESNYGQYLHNDLVHLLENFADTGPVNSPANPLVGQLWFDTAYQVLRVWNGTAWPAIRPDTLPNDAGMVPTAINVSPSIIGVLSSGVIIAGISNQAIANGALPSTVSYRNVNYEFQSNFPNGLGAGITIASNVELNSNDNSDTLVTSKWVKQQSYLTEALAGPTGPTGPAGATGGSSAGPTGPAGATGPTGPDINLADITAAGVFTNAQMNNTLAVIVNGLTPTIGRGLGQSAGDNATQAIYGGAAAPSGSTVMEVDGVVGTATTASASTPCVAGAFYAMPQVAGTQAFALNCLVADGDPTTGTFVSGVVGCEFDVGGYELDSTVLGNNMIGVFPNGTPGSGSSSGTAIAYQVSVLHAPWQMSFYSGNAVAGYALWAGSTLATGTHNNDSQTIRLVSYDGTGAQQIAGILLQHTTGTGSNLTFEVSTGGTQFVASNGYTHAFNQPISMAAYTVGTLPAASGLIGCYVTVTDALSPAWHAPVVGGGTAFCPVFSNGTNWIVI